MRNYQESDSQGQSLDLTLPEHNLRRGQVGTVVQELDGDSYEVEFSDDEGRTYAQLPLNRDQLIVLHHRPHEAA